MWRRPQPSLPDPHHTTQLPLRVTVQHIVTEWGWIEVRAETEEDRPPAPGGYGARRCDSAHQDRAVRAVDQCEVALSSRAGKVSTVLVFTLTDSEIQPGGQRGAEVPPAATPGVPGMQQYSRSGSAGIESLIQVVLRLTPS